MDTNEYFQNMTPTTRGQRYAYRAWEETQENRAEMFEAAEIPWGAELAEGVMADFVNTLREAGVETFVVTDHSTALMEGLHAIFATGCSLIGPATVKRHPRCWGDRERAGLEFKIN